MYEKSNDSQFKVIIAIIGLGTYKIEKFTYIEGWKHLFLFEMNR